MIDLYDYLKKNEYPGRGIVIGMNEAGRIQIGYFIMGRSANSRNRVFVKTNDGIRTEAYDPSKMEDPSLIIYRPVRVYQAYTIVTNGDQTDTIYSSLSEGHGFEDALLTRTFEPDAPNYTPRISGVIYQMNYQLSILKSLEGDGDYCVRNFYDYEFRRGTGHVIHTYMQDGTPLPSFTGEPAAAALKEDLETFTKKLWKALNEENKVSLYTREINPEDGSFTERIVNKNQ